MTIFNSYQKIPLSIAERGILMSCSQGGTEAAGDEEEIQSILDGGDHHITVADERTATALPAHDADGNICHIGHLDVIKAIADGDDAATQLFCFLGLDDAHFRGGEGQHL